MTPAICFEMLYRGLTPEEKIRRIAEHGFRATEFWGWRDKNIAALSKAVAENGVSIVNFSGHRAGDLVDASTHSVLLREIEESVPVARMLGASTMMVLTNELGEGGRVMHACPYIPEAEKRRNVVDGLRRVMERVPQDMTIVLEPLNTVLDHVGYFLNSMGAAVSIVEEVDNPRLKVLCDFYHLAMMGEDPVETARRYARAIGHVHIADYPGRHEPGTGRGNWVEVLAELARQGYQGNVGFEFSPEGDSDAALRAARDLWKKAFGSGGEI